MRFNRTAGVLLTVTLGLAACASADEVSTQTVDDPTLAAPTDPAAPADVPDVEVALIPSGDPVNLQTLAQGNDTLFWFWAPH